MGSWKRGILMSVGVICAGFAVFFLAALALNKSIASEAAAILKARRVIAERSYAFENLAELKAQGPEAARYLEKIDGLIPTEDALLSYPQFLEGLARTSNVGLNFAFNGSPTAPSAGSPGFVGVTITVSGTLGNAERFLRYLEFEATRFLTIIDSADVSADSSGYRATFQGRTFFK